MERKTTRISPDDIARQRAYCAEIKELNARFARAPLALSLIHIFPLLGVLAAIG